MHPVASKKIVPVDKRSVEEYIPISNLEPDGVYTQVFLVARVVSNDKMRTDNGNYFARVTLKDNTGEIEGVIWGYSKSLVEGNYVLMTIETKLYRGDIEFQVHRGQMEILSKPPINQYDYIRGISDVARTSYANEIEQSITSTSDPIYRDILCNAIHKLDLISALTESPYGLEGPMAYRGGLLVHVAHSIRLAHIAIQQAEELEIPLNSSLVIAGCILRNIGWHTTTLFQGDQLKPRDAYYMTGINRASARYIDHLMLTCESDLQIIIPEEKKQALENMCNEKSLIRTLEGQIVISASNMADVLDCGAAALRRKQRGNWSDELFVGHLE